jgi:4-amino-4-deoxychorismate lyase
LRLERHLARLYGSAYELGFVFDPEIVGKALGTVVGTYAQRVRLLLAADGKATVTTQPFVPVPAATVWTLRVANTRLASGDPLLRHKTTRRDIYQTARDEFQVSEGDEIILLNERGEVCEGTITSLFVEARDGGPLLTPGLSCGLLAGVLRGELIEQGKAREAVLMPADLVKASALFVGNSLRGIIPARLAGL